ncbi:hypothetical protein [Cohnella rhizosphaerae]|uniref:Uncharacterized protein n=1 Tax=Cohnella rhizosphaerae TaxID=1457232 RepID=A0A9X4KRB8_9BACL|nr:hypothetical protein [Cohnella rhizosphaerae]MDG0809238.1 hypothetical protein [Cohnella rhizosphaerae]
MVYDWKAGLLGSARSRTKAVYMLLLAIAVYHFLLVAGTISAPSYYDLFEQIYGGLAARIVGYFSPEGGA